VDHGVVNWPLEKRRLPVLIYTLPAAERGFETAASVIDPMNDEHLVNGFLTLATGALREMSQRSISHRAIRPDNIFYADGSKRSIQLGECVTAPAGMNQPIWYETVEGAMADERARGVDDLFAVGVTMLALLLGRNPLSNVDVGRFIEDRVNHGSYSAIVGSSRIQPNMLELLRGLLMDDPRERWSLRDIEHGVGGRRNRPSCRPRRRGRLKSAALATKTSAQWRMRWGAIGWFRPKLFAARISIPGWCAA
jgi:serine/threonine protein kinase